MKLTPYIAYAKKCFLGRSAYRFDHLMGILSTCMQFFIFCEIYKVLYGGSSEIDGITMSMVTTNFVLAMGLVRYFHPMIIFFPIKYGTAVLQRSCCVR